jgi:hypothetical protein
MATTKIKFYGLCGIGSIGGVFKASMPAVAGHKAVLAVRIDQMVLEPSETTTPDVIFHGPDGVQYGAWALDTRTLQFDGGSGSPAWAAGEQVKTINLAGFHAGVRVQSPRNGGATVVLPTGTLTAGTEPLDRTSFRVLQGGTEVANREFSVAIIWTGDFTVLRGERLKVTLKNGAVATVTNVAPIILGHEHFHHYYDEFFETPPEPRHLITLHNQNVTVFDCVPPVPLP